MKYNINCIYNYYDTLLSQWIDLNDTILRGNFADSADNLTEASGTDNSNLRSRAKECFRVGLLKHELTKGMNALNTVKGDVNLQSRLGFIADLVYRAYYKHAESEKLLRATAAINAIFSVIQPFEIRDVSVSVNTIVYRLLAIFPQPINIERGDWLRYLLSAFCCELKVANQGDDIRNFILGNSKDFTMRIIGNKGNDIRCTLRNAEDVKKAIADKISLTNIHHQKLPLFLFGTAKDKVTRGFYGLADKYFSDFLYESYKVETKDIRNSPFHSLYIDDESPLCKKGEVIETIKAICIKNPKLANKYQEVMKSIEDGAIEALMYMTDKPKSAFAFSWAFPEVNTKNNSIANCLTAIRTKPFLLLAGISGTGKSRIVRELAFKSCPKYLQDKDGTTPGNYCMIEVKPNWHDSTELLGYYSNLSKSYQFKKFVKFLVKAKLNPDVPFFVCLDEMNLAPVEHYFAEILSIIETRKHPKKENSDEVDMNVIKTGSIVENQYFKKMAWKDNGGALHQKTDMSDKDWYEYFFDVSIMSEGEKAQIAKYQYERTLQAEGLTLPDNVIIIGTVNMDDTTHQFSRKVIDRAMTIEMNGGKLSDMYGGSNDLEYLDEAEQEKWQKAFVQRYVTADEVLKEHSEVADKIIEEVPEKLDNINKALKGTPFEVSYRVLNELTIMIGVMLDDPAEEGDIESIIDKALDRILLMKILPRIEGDADMFNLSSEFKKKNDITHENRLEWLKELAPNIVISEDEPHQQTAREKIQEMIERLKNQEFTRFWP